MNTTLATYFSITLAIVGVMSWGLFGGTGILAVCGEYPSVRSDVFPNGTSWVQYQGHIYLGYTTAGNEFSHSFPNGTTWQVVLHPWHLGCRGLGK